jgi:hypothetical protein
VAGAAPRVFGDDWKEASRAAQAAQVNNKETSQKVPLLNL